MKADISDAPARVIRGRHTPNVFHVVICLLVGSLTTVGAFLLISRDSSSQHSMSPAGEVGQSISTGKMPPRQDLDASRVQAPSDIRPPTDTARQTVFNNQNFIPRGADNVVNLGVTPVSPPKKERPKPVKVTVVAQPVSMKDRACWPHKQGSIDYRNCRAYIGLKHRD